MAQRLMEIIVPARHGANVRDAVGEQTLLGVWHDDKGETVMLQVLVPAEEVEPLMDRVEQRCAGTERFHVVLLPVDATLPRPEPQETEAVSAATPDGTEQRKRYRVSREELYAALADSTKTSPVFLGLTVLSAVVAAVGLLRDDLAVVIGAMVIAPLLGPNVALALATTLGDFDLARDALRANVFGVSLALVVSIAVGAVLHVDPSLPGLLSRTEVGLGDLVLALAAGAAGTLAFTSGLSGAIIGVMVAVALLPPLVTFGLLVGARHAEAASGALLLVVANFICVNLAGVSTFLLQGVRPRTWWEAERARKASRAAMVLWVVLLLLLAATLLVARGRP
jgi:uncharacterized hydrophobic protein (TIGR00341 family)